MVDPTTVNKFLNQPLRGSDVGVWDTPVNDNMGIIDNSFGGVATIALVNTPVTLSPSQYQCVFLVFTGAISANVPITLPSVGSFYTIINQTTNSSAFGITMLTTAAGGRQVGVPPGTTTEVFTDGTNVNFRGLPHVGAYWDYAGSSTPAWVTACTIPPYLYCDGTAFSSATYPRLQAILGGTTLPDFRGRNGVYYNDGTGRVTSSQGGLDGNTLYAAGGGQTTTLSSQQMPNYQLPVTDPGHAHTGPTQVLFTGGTGVGAVSGGTGASIPWTQLTAVTNITVNSGGSGSPVPVVQPGVVSGIRLIRAG